MHWLGWGTTILWTAFWEHFFGIEADLPPAEVILSNVFERDGDGNDADRLVRAVLDEVDRVFADQDLSGNLLARQNEGALVHVTDSVAWTQLGDDHTWKELLVGGQLLFWIT